MNEKSGCFAFLRQLMADKITCIFGNPGTSEENLLDALSQPDRPDSNSLKRLAQSCRRRCLV
ncbi:MAG TPA: hypothetical protein VE860_11180 [Chthoniobacterales bacterium]|nr:hypothetical protein [Chthoniobacterales bacterium]